MEPHHIVNRPPLPVTGPLIVFAHVDPLDGYRIRTNLYYNLLFRLYSTGTILGKNTINVLWVGPKFWKLCIQHGELDASIWKASYPRASVATAHNSGMPLDEYSPLHPNLGPNNIRLSDMTTTERHDMILHPTASTYCRRHTHFDPFSLRPAPGIRNELKPASSDGVNPNANILRVWREMRERRRANRSSSNATANGSLEEEQEVLASRKLKCLLTKLSVGLTNTCLYSYYVRLAGLHLTEFPSYSIGAFPKNLHFNFLIAFPPLCTPDHMFSFHFPYLDSD